MQWMLIRASLFALLLEASTAVATQQQPEQQVALVSAFFSFSRFFSSISATSDLLDVL